MDRTYKSVPDAKLDALNALDVLLGSGYPQSSEKLAALKEVAAAAARMVKNIEQWDRDAIKAEMARAEASFAVAAE
jgi:hypothetical protein